MDVEKVEKVEKGLECCQGHDCGLCPYDTSECWNDTMFEKLSSDALSVIRELKAENERLKEQQPKKGHWFIDEYEYLDCSVCGESYYTGCETTEEAKRRLANGEHYKFCPYCGADMRGEQE